jgi:hypothetical protein
METNRGVDVSFDIIDSEGKSWTQNVILSYNGVTTVPDDGLDPIAEPILKSPPGSIQLQMWTLRNVNVDAGNEVSYYSSQPNSAYTQLTGRSGYASVFGVGNSWPSSLPLLDTINFKSPIIINRIK